MTAFQAIIALASSSARRPGAEERVAAGEEVDVSVAEARAVLPAQPLGHPDHGDVLDEVHVQAVLEELVLDTLLSAQAATGRRPRTTRYPGLS